MSHPIPADALDDRLGYFGTAGSGKTYNAGSGVERLLHGGKRCIIPDPLGVWWGLRLAADGKVQSGFKVVIFGGPHGDLPLTEHVGALIGETVAGMKESCILDLSELGTKASERRFMLAFLAALYKHASGEPVHVVFDEADMWAPQKLLDKEGEAAKLLGMMETLVRRGRVKGFIPWLISQRPAVLSKDVLSQVDGLVAFKLTSSQDRDALGDWVKGQADIGQWNEIWKSLPTLERGQGVVWLPARSTLKTAHFPQKVTFDSSRTPKRGEKLKHQTLKPLDLEKLRDRLATVEAETKANDPKVLKAEIARLKKEAADAAKAKPALDPDAIAKAEQRGFERGVNETAAAADRRIRQRRLDMLTELGHRVTPLMDFIAAEVKVIKSDKAKLADQVAFAPSSGSQSGNGSAPSHARAATPPRRTLSAAASGDGSLTPTQQAILNAIGWAHNLGNPAPTRVIVAFLAGSSPKSSTFEKYTSQLRAAGLISFPRTGAFALTDEGHAKAVVDERGYTHDDIMAGIQRKLTPSQMAILRAATAAYPSEISRGDLAAGANMSATSSTFEKYVSQLCSIGVIDKRGPGLVRASEGLFP